MTNKKRGSGIEFNNKVEGDGEPTIALVTRALKHHKDFPKTRMKLIDLFDDGLITVMPTTITAANGCRAALEEEFEVPWETIQAIFRKLVEHFELR